MKIAIASDASGFRLKEHVKQVLREAGHDVTDVGQQREDETVRYYEAGELWRAPFRAARMSAVL